MPLSSGMIEVCRADRRRKGLDRIVEVERLAAQQHDVEFFAELVGLHRRWIFQRDVAGGALDHEAGAGQFGRRVSGAPETSRRARPAATCRRNIRRWRRRRPRECALTGLSFLVVLKRRVASGEQGRVDSPTRYPLHSPSSTTSPRTGEFPAQRSRRCAAAGRAASRMRRPRPAASAGPDCRALPCPRAFRGARAPRRCRRRNR